MMRKPVKRAADWERTGQPWDVREAISSRLVFLDGWLKGTRTARFFIAVILLLATFLSACSKELWPAYQLSEGIVFETQHSIAEFTELQKAHRNCQRVTEVGAWSLRSDEQARVAEKAPGRFCASVSSRTTAHPGSVDNGYQRWMRGETRALPKSGGGEGLGGEGS